MIVGYAEWEDTQKDILDRVNIGETISSLAREYGTTPNIMSLHVEKLRKRKKLLEENELYYSMYYSNIEVSAKMAKRIINSLNRSNITTIEELKKLSIEDLLNIRNLGLGQIEVMQKFGWIKENKDYCLRKKIQVVVPIGDRIITNGDMIEALFPDLNIINENGCIGIERINDSTHVWIDQKWWNTPYTGKGERG